MGARTYIPTVIFLSREIVRFISRYREQLSQNLPAGQLDLVDALLVAANAILDALDIVQSN